MKEILTVFFTWCLFLFIFGSVIASLMFGIPKWYVWQKGESGKAILASAQQTKQVLITQAEAEREAAKFRAEAIAIVGEAAKKYPEYRQQEFIGAFADAMQEGKISQIIYVPTEGNIPVLEAGKR